MMPDIIVRAIAYPVIAGAVCLFAGDRLKIIIRSASLLVSAYVLFLSCVIFTQKPSGGFFVADGLSAFTGAAASVFALLVIIYSFGFNDKGHGRYFGYVLMTLGSALGAVYADNLILMLVFWGFLALLLYLLTAMGKAAGSAQAAKKALIMIGGTDALAMFGIALIWSLTGTLSISKISLGLDGVAPCMAYAMIAIASFAKSGAVPLHSWIPDVAQDAPAPVAAYLPACLDKLLGIYLLVRCSVDMFAMNAYSNLILAAAGSVTIIFAVVMALAQHDLKRLLGYHAISQVGYMVLGIGTGTAVGIAGSLFHMLNNAIYKSCLFLAGGSVEKKAGTTDLASLGGLSKYMPVTFASFLVASLSISGIPPFNGFVSKWMIYQGIIESAPAFRYTWLVWLAAAMFGSALTVASFMKLLHAVFMGRASKGMDAVKDAGFSMSMPAVVLASLCLVLGILAFVIPIPMWIIPAIKSSPVILGSWHPAAASALLLLGLAVGAIVYLFIRSPGVRVTEGFVGGEDQDKLDRIAGTEFYTTVKEVGPIGALYEKEGSGRLDIYNVGSLLTLRLTGFLKGLHNGILPTYIAWCFLGAIAILIFLFFGTVAR